MSDATELRNQIASLVDDLANKADYAEQSNKALAAEVTALKARIAELEASTETPGDTTEGEGSFPDGGDENDTAPFVEFYREAYEGPHAELHGMELVRYRLRGEMPSETIHLHGDVAAGAYAIKSNAVYILHGTFRDVEFRLHGCRNVVIEAAPEGCTLLQTDKNQKTFFEGDADSENITILCDGMRASHVNTNAGGGGYMPIVFRPGGKNWRVGKGLEVGSVSHVVLGNLKPEGVLVESWSAGDNHGIRENGMWVSGRNWCARDIFARNSTFEHIIRASDIDGFHVSLCDLTNLDRREGFDDADDQEKHDHAKGCIVIQRGRHIEIADNVTRTNDETSTPGGGIGAGPLAKVGSAHGDDTSLTEYVWVHHNECAHMQFDNGLQHAVIESNDVGRFGIELRGPTTPERRTSKDILFTDNGTPEYRWPQGTELVNGKLTNRENVRVA